MTDFAERIDALTIDDLRAAGSLKWTTYPDAIGAWVAEMDFGLAPAVSAAIDSFWTRQLTGYSPMDLRSGIQQATAAFVSERYGWALDADRVHQLPDVLTGLIITMSRWIPAASTIIVPTPCYMPFTEMPEAFGHHKVELPMLRNETGWAMDLDGLERAFADGAKLLVLCTPHNPIGKVYDRDELEAICEIVERHGGLVFSDEIHAPLTYPGVQHIPYASLNPTAAAHTVTAMSASKTFNLAGLKCAQLVLTNDEHQRDYTGYGHGIPVESSPIGLATNIAAYREGGEWLAEMLDYLDGNRKLVTELVAELLPGVGYHEPDATYLALLDCRGLGLDDPRAHFLAAGVALTDGADCGESGRGYVRLNFAMPRPLVRQAIEQMAASLA